MLTCTALRILAPLFCLLEAIGASETALTPRSSIDVIRKRNSGPDNAGCLALAKKFNGENNLFYENSNVYNYENSPREFWSNTEILSPSCVFRPTSAGQIGDAVKILRDANIKFAVRGGGHMGVTVRKFTDYWERQHLSWSEANLRTCRARTTSMMAFLW